MIEAAPHATPPTPASFADWQARVHGTNISEQTLLATDYLNHFNEIVMLLEMVPDMPDLLEECKAWQPKSYQDHFRDSAFSDKDLAVAAYDHVPARFRQPFEDTIERMNQAVTQSLDKLEKAVAEDNPDAVRHLAVAASRGLQRLMEVANAIIHGSDRAMDQTEIDDIFGL